MEIEEEEFDESEESQVDMKSVTSEVDRKFRQLTKLAKYDSKISRIIEDEAAESVIVKGESYAKLYRLCGGFCITLVVNLAVLFQIFSMVLDNLFI
jgi:hypothetical protein